jgi:hypothetical protein
VMAPVADAARTRLLTLAPDGARPPVSVGLSKMLLADQGADRRRMLLHRLFPPRAWMERENGLRPGSLAVAVHYAWRPFRLLARYAPHLVGVALGFRRSAEAVRAGEHDLLLEAWFATAQRLGRASGHEGLDNPAVNLSAH